MLTFRGMLSGAVRDRCREEVSSRGFFFASGLAPSATTLDVASWIGNPEIIGRSALVQSLRPRASDAAPLNTYSGAYGFDAFPMHTDLAHWHRPPRYFLLRAVNGAKDVPTQLIDGAALIRRVGASLLGRGVMRPRRPKAGQVSLLSIFQRTDDFSGLLRWDERFIVPASRTGEEARTAMIDAISSSPTTDVPLALAGDTLVVDNWRMLHGRGRVPAGSHGRIVERCYMGNLS